MPPLPDDLPDGLIPPNGPARRLSVTHFDQADIASYPAFAREHFEPTDVTQQARAHIRCR